jgi:hypothetical protein
MGGFRYHSGFVGIFICYREVHSQRSACANERGPADMHIANGNKHLTLRPDVLDLETEWRILLPDPNSFEVSVID